MTFKCEVVEPKISSAEFEEPTSPSTELSLVSTSKPSSKKYMQSSHSGVSLETIGCYNEVNPCRDTVGIDHCANPHSWFHPLLHHTSAHAASSSHSHHDKDEAETATKMSLQKDTISNASSTKTECLEGTTTCINLDEMPIEGDPDVTLSMAPNLVLKPIVKTELVVDLEVEKLDKPLIQIQKKEQISYAQSYKAQVDPVAAAEARKRRKEIKKLKFVHGRQISLHG